MGILLCIFLVASSTINRRSLKMMRLICSGFGSLIKVSEYSLRYSRFSLKMGKSGVENSCSSWFILVLLMILSTSSLTWVNIFLKLACTSIKAWQSLWLGLVFLIIYWKSISYLAMRKVGCNNSFSAILLVFIVYCRQISLIYLLVFISSCRNFWADSAFKI